MHKGCVECRFAQWQYTPTGRIKKNETGNCLAPLPDVNSMLPHSVHSQVYISKGGIWPGLGTDCPVWEKKTD